MNNHEIHGKKSYTTSHQTVLFEVVNPLLAKPGIPLETPKKREMPEVINPALPQRISPASPPEPVPTRIPQPSVPATR